MDRYSRIQELYKDLQQYLSMIRHPQLKALLDLFFKDNEFVHEYCYAPSAITHHHNYLGGNLEHTIGVLRLCSSIAEYYHNVNMDLLLTGAILHDIGKLKEYGYGAAIDKTDIGNFIGHIVIGDRWLRRMTETLRSSGKAFDEDLEHHLAHILLSHHGKYEWGSPRMPKTLEASIVHQADFMDSQVKFFMQTIETNQQASDDHWGFVYDSDLGRRRLVYLKPSEQKQGR